jgi:hypothetical protein
MSTVRIQLRRGTATEWTNADTDLNASGGLVLAAGEMAVETNTRKIKIGDGTSRWSALSYVASDSPAITEIAQDAIDQALSMGSGLAKSYNDSTNTISISIDDTVVALKSYVDSQVGGLENTVTTDYVLLADVGNAGGPAKLDVDGNLLVPKSSIVLEGATANAFETTLTVVDPTADRTITFPDATTTVVGTDTAQTLSNKVLTTPTINGPTITDTGQTPTIHGIYLPAPHNIIFEGTTANDFETTLTAGEPTADRTITLPDASGTVALTSDITSAVNGLVDAAPGALDTLNELAAAIGDDANYAAGITTALGNLSSAGVSHASASTNVHGIANTANLATMSYADQAESDAKTYADSAIGTAVENHRNDSTDVHGIVDTADLMLKSGSSMTGNLTLNGAPSFDLQASTKKYVDDTKNTHAAVTTSVHGIADTAELATKSYADTAEADAITAAGTAADTKISTAVAALTKSSVGLANVDNTADADKPVSTATQTALDGKASLSGATFTGNVEMDGNLVVDGDLTINGTAFNASSTSIVIEDNMVQLAHQNAANTVDLGIVVGYNDGAAKHSGLVRDVSDAKWKLFKGVTTEPTTTVDFSEGSLDDLAVNNVVAAGVVFTDGTQTKEGVPSRTPIISKVASYTLSAESERDSLIEVDSTDPITITIPTNSAVAYPVGTTLDILGVNTGLITIEGDTGVTVNATPGLKLRTQWSSCTLFKRATDSWVVYGDLKA